MATVIPVGIPAFNSAGSAGGYIARIDNPVQFSDEAVTAALLHGGGTSSAPVTNPDANLNFLGYWLEHTATSGDNRGLYLRTYFAGAGGGGDAARLFATVDDVAAGTVHGAHVSLSFASTGTVTGLGVAMRATLHIANQATQNGTLAAIQAEIWSDGATSDPAGSLLSVFRVVSGGNATGMADVDTDAFLFNFSGFTAGSGKMISDAGNEPTWTSKTHKIKCRLPDGSTCYLLAVID